MNTYIIIVFFILALSFVLALTVFFTRKKRLNIQDKIYFRNILNRIKYSKKSSDKEKLINLDKLYHKILLRMGYKGSFGDILKHNSKCIKNLNKIWKLHKLRNKLVHSFEDFNLKKIKNSREEYILEINKLLK